MPRVREREQSQVCSPSPWRVDDVRTRWKSCAASGTRATQVSEAQPLGIIQIGGRDFELRTFVLEELAAVGIPAEITTDRDLLGEDPANIGNQTQLGGCVQLEMGRRYRASLFGTDTRPRRKHTTNAQFWLLVGALRKAMSKASIGNPARLSCHT